jgi:hypothetical protein
MNAKHILVGALIGAAVVAGVAGEADARKRLSATRAQVSAVCEAQGATLEWGTHSGATGGYGCQTRGGWISCDAGGSCQGERISPRGDFYGEGGRPNGRGR